MQTGDTPSPLYQQKQDQDPPGAEVSPQSTMTEKIKIKKALENHPHLKCQINRTASVTSLCRK